MGSDDRSFFIIYDRECSEELEVPKLFVSRSLSRVPETFVLKSSKGFSNVVARKTGESVFFSGGWPSFVQNNNVLEGDFLTFRYKGGPCFIVNIFGLHACRKDADLPELGVEGNISTRSRGSGGGGVSPLVHPKEELQSSSEEEGSRAYGGGSRRMGKAPMSSSEDDSTSSDHDNRGGGRRFRMERTLPRHLSSGGEEPKAGVLRIPGASTRELQSSSEEEGHGGYSGAVHRMRRASFSPLGDDISYDGSRRGGRSIRRSRTPPRHLSSGRHGPKPGTLRNYKVPTKLTPQPWAKNRNSGKEELQSRFEEEGQGGYGGGARRMGRAPLSSMEDESSDDDNSGGGRRIQMGRTLPRHRSSGGNGSKAGALRIPRSARSSSEEEGRGGYSGAFHRMTRASLFPSEDDSSDDGNRGGGRNIWRSRTPTRHLSSGRHGPKPGASGTHMATAPQSQVRSRGSGMSAQFHPKEKQQSNVEEEWLDWLSWRRSATGKTSPSVLKDDSSDDGSRGSGRRIQTRTPPRRLSSGRDGPKTGVSSRIHKATARLDPVYRPKEELQSSWEEEGQGGYLRTGRASISGWKEDRSGDVSQDGRGRIRKRTCPYCSKNVKRRQGWR